MDVSKNQETVVTQAHAEQRAFSQRLTCALDEAGMKASPTALAKAFNAQADGPVTVHAVRKWLVGESIPTQAKLIILAKLISVPVTWLRFGEGTKPAATPVSLEQIELAGAITRLMPHQRRAVLAVIKSFAAPAA